MRLWTAESGFESLPPNQPDSLVPGSQVALASPQANLLFAARRYLVVFWLLLAATLAFRSVGVAADDVYITYRYAQNFALGRGLVFNPGERVFGETEPGVALLLGGLHALLRIPIPVLGGLVSLLALVAIAGLLLLEASRRGRLAEAAAAGTLVVGCSYLWDAQGTAAPLVAALLILAARVAERRPRLAGALCGAAVWCRPDALVGAGLLGLMLWWERRRFPWRLAAVGAAVAGAGALLALVYYGSVIPGTLGAKQLHAARNPAAWIGFGVFWQKGLRWFAPAWGSAAAWLLALGALGLPRFWRGAGRGGRLLMMNGLALTAVYPLLRVPFFPWYGIPTLLALIYGLPAAIGGLWELTMPRFGDRPGRAIATVAAAVAALSIGAATLAWWRDDGASNWRLRLYSDAGRWLGEHSTPEEAIGFPEIGILAFTADRRVEDLLGLVTPRSLPFAREGDVEGAFLASPATFMLEHSHEGQGAFLPIVRRDWFRAAYAEVKRFDYGGGEFVAIYRRREQSQVPPPRPPRLRVAAPDPMPGADGGHTGS